MYVSYRIISGLAGSRGRFVRMHLLCLMSTWYVDLSTLEGLYGSRGKVSVRKMLDAIDIAYQVVG